MDLNVRVFIIILCVERKRKLLHFFCDLGIGLLLTWKCTYIIMCIQLFVFFIGLVFIHPNLYIAVNSTAISKCTFDYELHSQMFITKLFKASIRFII